MSSQFIRLPQTGGGGGGGTVTSVSLTGVAGVLSVAGSPITTTGTFALSFDAQAAGTIFAGPASGPAAAPTFRAISSSDLPGLTGDVTAASGSNITTVAAIQGNTVTGTTGTGNVVFSIAPNITGLVTMPGQLFLNAPSSNTWVLKFPSGYTIIDNGVLHFTDDIGTSNNFDISRSLLSSNVEHHFLDLISMNSQGSVNRPTLRFNTFSGETGIFQRSTDSMNFSSAGVEVGSINNNSEWIFGTTGATITHVFNGNFTSNDPVAGDAVWSFTKDLNAGDTTNICALLIGNSGAAQGFARWRYNNQPATGTPFVTLDFAPRNNADTGSAISAEMYFAKSSGSDGSNFTLATSTTGGVLNTALYVAEDGAFTIGPSTGTPTHTLNTNTATPSVGVLTMTNGPGASTGNPAVYLVLNINGTNYVFPGWAF